MRIVIFIWLTLIPAVGFAEMSQKQLREILSDRIVGLEMFVKNAIFISAVKKQNQENKSLEEINRIDEEWRAGSSPLLAESQNSKAGKYLKNIIIKQADIYNEAFLTDQKGANVAAYPATSDYWQGDEDKFTLSYNGGKGKVYVGKMEYDESSKTNAVQISIPLFYGGKTIGVFVIGVKLSHIEADRLVR